jgi:hypothetical protein
MEAHARRSWGNSPQKHMACRQGQGRGARGACEVRRGQGRTPPTPTPIGTPPLQLVVRRSGALRGAGRGEPGRKGGRAATEPDCPPGRGRLGAAVRSPPPAANTSDQGGGAGLGSSPGTCDTFPGRALEARRWLETPCAAARATAERTAPQRRQRVRRSPVSRTQHNYNTAHQQSGLAGMQRAYALATPSSADWRRSRITRRQM